MFQQFKELRSLNLSFNKIDGFIENYEGFDRLSSSLNKLQVLDLSYNRFNNSILLLVASLTSLKTLNLSFNRMEGSFPIQELLKLENLEYLDASNNNFSNTLPVPVDQGLGKLNNLKVLRLVAASGFLNLEPSDGTVPIQNFSSFRNLEILDLTGNYFIGSIPEYMWTPTSLKALHLSVNKLNGSLPNQKFSTLKSLEILDLSLNKFTGNLPEYTWAPTSLKALSLSGNQLNGPLPNQSLCDLKRLEELDLSNNNFGGNLPDCLINLTSFRFLDLSENQFTGHFPSYWLSSMKSLKFIDLRNNLFQGLFSFNFFSNHPDLEVVDLSHNRIELESKYSANRVPPFQLKFFAMGNCGLDRIPEFLFHQSKLKVIDLSHNKILERFPNWLLENNTELEHLNFRNNNFMGEIQLPIYSSYNISFLDISDNSLYGQLQEIGENIFPKMGYLNLSTNDFQGDFFFSPSEGCKLTSLDLSFNNFSGEVPERLISRCTSLRTLKLSHNNFHGQIFTPGFNLTRLYSLQLDDNRFSGTLSGLVTEFTWPYISDLSYNSFHGEIPRWMNNNTKFVSFMDLSFNGFEGKILCKLLSPEYVDLSHNSFSRSLPSCFNQQDSQHINLQGNKLSGPIADAFVNCSNLVTLNLRDNSLPGSIPIQFGTFPNLRILLLGGNHLNGPIPNCLCQLNNITLLDLSINSFSGSIPHCLFNLSFGTRKEFTSFTIEASESDYESPVYSSSLVGIGESSREDITYINFDQEFEFVTKHRADPYKGDILNFMSGLDLSLNSLTGEIPFELGKLSQILALNLSHNKLIGSIPSSFSNLTQVESLDLSHNKLSGDIPFNLINLNFLEVFSVAYNNLSGKAPDMKYQFSTFDNSSYEGNPFLFGPQLGKNCNNDDNESPKSPTELPHDAEEDGKWYEIDRVVFFASFCVSFIIFFLGVTLYFMLILIGEEDCSITLRNLCFHVVTLCMILCSSFFLASVVRAIITCSK